MPANAMPPPAPAGAWLAENVLKRTKVFPAALNTPPPMAEATLSEIVELLIEVLKPTEVSLRMPPPWLALLLLIVLRLTVRFP